MYSFLGEGDCFLIDVQADCLLKSDFCLDLTHSAFH